MLKINALYKENGSLNRIKPELIESSLACTNLEQTAPHCFPSHCPQWYTVPIHCRLVEAFVEAALTSKYHQLGEIAVPGHCTNHCRVLPESPVGTFVAVRDPWQPRVRSLWVPT